MEAEILPNQKSEVVAAGHDTWLEELSKVRHAAKALENSMAADSAGDRSLTEIQAWLRNLDRALGYEVWIASNDRGRAFDGATLGTGCLDKPPDSIEAAPGADSIRLTDVLWLTSDQTRVIAAFEVEHTTSIYSGIVRMLDLAFSTELTAIDGLLLVAPDAREESADATQTARIQSHC